MEAHHWRHVQGSWQQAGLCGSLVDAVRGAGLGVACLRWQHQQHAASRSKQPQAAVSRAFCSRSPAICSPVGMVIIAGLRRGGAAPQKVLRLAPAPKTNRQSTSRCRASGSFPAGGVGGPQGRGAMWHRPRSEKPRCWLLGGGVRELGHGAWEARAGRCTIIAHFSAIL